MAVEINFFLLINGCQWLQIIIVKVEIIIFCILMVTIDYSGRWCKIRRRIFLEEYSETSISINQGDLINNNSNNNYNINNGYDLNYSVRAGNLYLWYKKCNTYHKKTAHQRSRDIQIVMKYYNKIKYISFKKSLAIYI